MWNSEAQEAFEKLKVAVTFAPVLALPNFTIPFEIECDASGKGVGVVLLQQKRLIAFFSKAFVGAHLSKYVYEKELMALVLVVQYWRQYLMGRKFIVHSDQKSLKHLLEQRITKDNQQTWMSKLMGFQFDIMYKKGKENVVADALSRQHEIVECSHILSFPVWKESTEVEKEVAQDSEMQKIIQDLQQGTSSWPGYSLFKEKFFYKKRLVIPAKLSLMPILLAEYHSSPSGGHSGFLLTYRRMAANLYWKGMKKQIS